MGGPSLIGKATAKGQDAFATGNVIGTNRELLLVLAVSLAARVAASNRSMKISASMTVPSNALTLSCRFCRPSGSEAAPQLKTKE